MVHGDVGMTDPGGDEAHQDFISARRIKLERLDLERLAMLAHDRSHEFGAGRGIATVRTRLHGFRLGTLFLSWLVCHSHPQRRTELLYMTGSAAFTSPRLRGEVDF